MSPQITIDVADSDTLCVAGIPEVQILRETPEGEIQSTPLRAFGRLCADNDELPTLFLFEIRK